MLARPCILFFVLLFGCPCSFAQPCTGDGGNYIKYFGTTGEDRVNTIERIGDDGYVILWSRFDGVTFSAYVTMLDLCGDLLWQKSMHGQAYGLPTGLVYFDDQLYIACYKEYPNVQTALVVLDLQGNFVSAKSLSSDNAIYPRRMIATADGNFIKNGVCNSAEGAGTNDFYVCKLTPDGTILWDKLLGHTANDFGHNVLEDSDGNYVVCGYTRDYVAGVYKGCALKLDASGNVMWAKEFHKGNGYTSIGHVTQHGDFYYLAGASNYGTLGDYDALLIKTDLNGNVIWSKFYATNGSDRMAVVIGPGDDLYITGTAHAGSSGTDAFVGKIDDNGNILELGSFGTSTDETCSAFGINFGLASPGFYGLAYGAAGIGNTDVIFYRFHSIPQICNASGLSLQVNDAAIIVNNYVHQVNTPSWSFGPVVYNMADAPFNAGVLCERVAEPVDTVDPPDPPDVPEPVDSIIHEPVVEFDGFEPVNIFTPNGDGINDLFTFAHYAYGITEFHCTIVNRWGVTLATLDDIADSWNGCDGGSNRCTDGVYFYVYSGTTVSGASFKGQGTVQLIAGN